MLFDRPGLDSDALATDAVWKAFNLLLSGFGYSGSSAADVMTDYYIINWEVVNGTDASKNISGIKAVCQQLATTLAANADFAGMSNAKRQRMAEGLGYLAAIAGAGKNELVKKGDGAGLAQLQSAVHQSVLQQQQGVDLKRLRLTAQGFAPAIVLPR